LEPKVLGIPTDLEGKRVLWDSWSWTQQREKKRELFCIYILVWKG